MHDKTKTMIKDAKDIEQGLKQLHKASYDFHKPIKVLEPEREATVCCIAMQLKYMLHIKISHTNKRWQQSNDQLAMIAWLKHWVDERIDTLVARGAEQAAIQLWSLLLEHLKTPGHPL